MSMSTGTSFGSPRGDCAQSGDAPDCCSRSSASGGVGATIAHLPNDALESGQP